MLFRFRSFTPPDIATKDYPHLINICWSYDPDAREGMPPGELHDRMIEMEQRLDSIEGSGVGFLVLAITGNGRKEWIWYVADKAGYMARVNEAMAGVDPLPLEFETSEDPGWENFTALLASVGERRH